MSPQSAKALKVGDHVAIRGPQDIRHFSHIAAVSKTTAAYFWIVFHSGDNKSGRIRISDPEVLRTLRHADVAETQGYMREGE